MARASACDLVVIDSEENLFQSCPTFVMQPALNARPAYWNPCNGATLNYTSAFWQLTLPGNVLFISSMDATTPDRIGAPWIMTGQSTGLRSLVMLCSGMLGSL